MKILLKVTSAFSALVFLLSCNLCTVECAVASEEHSHSIQGTEAKKHCHEAEEKNGHSDSDEHGAGETCCSSLVTVSAPSSFPTNFGPLRHLIGDAPAFERFFPQVDTRFERVFEFPPGASPPSVYFLTHFTHAPPVFL